MTTSPTTSLSSPSGDQEIPLGTLAYMRARYRNRMHELVLEEFQKSGISRATLARRLKTAPEIISRRLGAPGNWRMDTVSDLLFAIAGAEMAKEVSYPLEAAPRNLTAPEWLNTSSSMSVALSRLAKPSQDQRTVADYAAELLRTENKGQTQPQAGQEKISHQSVYASWAKAAQ